MDERHIVKTYVGADGRTLTLTMKDADGDALDLTGYTLTIKAVYGGATKINAKTMTVSAPATGVATYTPASSEINEAGDYRAQVKLVSGGLTDFSEVFIIRVLEVV